MNVRVITIKYNVNQKNIQSEGNYIALAWLVFKMTYNILLDYKGKIIQGEIIP